MLSKYQDIYRIKPSNSKTITETLLLNEKKTTTTTTKHKATLCINVKMDLILKISLTIEQVNNNNRHKFQIKRVLF